MSGSAAHCFRSYPAVSLPSPVHPLGQKKMPWTMISSFVLWSVSVFFICLFVFVFYFLERRISTCLTYTPRECRSREPGSGFPVDSFLLSQEPHMPLSMVRFLLTKPFLKMTHLSHGRLLWLCGVREEHIQSPES